MSKWLPSLFFPGASKTVVFVVGCQRSGTTMFLNVLGRSRQVRIYQEGDPRAFAEHFRLKSDSTIERLIRRSHRRVVVFKPLNDSQHTDRLLNLHPRAKAIWIYRNYADVIHSAIAKWGDDYKTIVESLSQGDGRCNSAATERLSPETKALIQRFGGANLSREDGAAFIWYMRNILFFERGLERNRKVLLCNYEALVTNPEERFREVFDFLECEFTPRCSTEVHRDSVAKVPAPVLSHEVEKLCASLMERLDECYRGQPGFGTKK